MLTVSALTVHGSTQNKRRKFQLAQANIKRSPDRVRVNSEDPLTLTSVISTSPMHEPEVQPASFRIAVLSDLNSAYGSTSYNASVHAATEALVERLRPAIVLITGDMVAGQKPGLDYVAMWRGFRQTVSEPLLDAGIAIAPTPGNHDASPLPQFAKERAIYVSEWTTEPRVAKVRFIDRSGYPLNYSFTFGGVFFASLDAAAVGPLPSEQHAWLEAQLSNTQAKTKIVFGHLPVHPFAVRRELEILGDRALSQLLSRYSVTAYISGHHHAYYPGAVNGVRHVAMPCLGSGARRLLGESRRSRAALVLVEIEAGELTSLEAFAAPEFDTTIARDSLPPFIQRGRHRVVRDDLAGLVSKPPVSKPRISKSLVPKPPVSKPRISKSLVPKSLVSKSLVSKTGDEPLTR